jgi:hypothetical protein
LPLATVDEMVARFEVEAEVTMAGRPGVALIITRRLSDAEFEIRTTSNLGGRRVLHFDVPRALDADGNQRTDVMGFVVEVDGGESFTVGEVVELSDT